MKKYLIKSIKNISVAWIKRPKQEEIYKLTNKKLWENSIVVIISISALLLGVEVSYREFDNLKSIFYGIEVVIVSIFVLDVCLRIYGQGISYFTYFWNLFDLIIVAIITLALIGEKEAFAILRLLRVIPILLLFSKIDQVQEVIDGLRKAIPGMSSIFLILVIVFFMFAVLGTGLFGDLTHDGVKYFENLRISAYTLFQIMLEGWSDDIIRPIMSEIEYSWIYFVSFILITTFIVLNLLIAIIVSAMEQVNQSKVEEKDSEIEPLTIQLLREIQSLREEVKNLESKIEQQNLQKL